MEPNPRWKKLQKPHYKEMSVQDGKYMGTPSEIYHSNFVDIVYALVS